MNARLMTLCLMLQIFTATSQEVLPTQRQVWMAYLSETTIATSKISINVELLEVPGAFLMTTAGGSYAVGPNLKLTGAYAQLWFNKENPQNNMVEFRPWLQMATKSKWRKFALLNRLRYEARWNKHLSIDGPGSEINYKGRVRYFVQLKYPLFEIGHHKMYLFTGNEVLFHLTKSISLDQERWSSGIGLQTENFTLQVSYMYRSKSYAYYARNQIYNTLCLNLFHYINV